MLPMYQNEHTFLCENGSIFPTFFLPYTLPPLIFHPIPKYFSDRCIPSYNKRLRSPIGNRVFFLITF